MQELETWLLVSISRDTGPDFPRSTCSVKVEWKEIDLVVQTEQKRNEEHRRNSIQGRSIQN